MIDILINKNKTIIIVRGTWKEEEKKKIILNIFNKYGNCSILFEMDMKKEELEVNKGENMLLVQRPSF